MIPRPALVAVTLLAGALVFAGCQGRPDRSALVGGVAGATVGNKLSRSGRNKAQRSTWSGRSARGRRYRGPSMIRLPWAPLKACRSLGVVALSFWLAGPAAAQDDEDLAQQLANPIASLVSVPLQLNFDRGLGPDGDGRRTVLNIQPVIPFSIGEDWNLISRTIVPVITFNDGVPGSDTKQGVGDTVQSFFFSPKTPTAGGLIWGVGPAFLLPTATEDAFGTGKWAAGPTAVALVQRGPWTVGGLANHLWSFAGDEDRADFNQTFVQPFASYTTGNAWTFSVTSESSYNWETEQWTVPVNGTVSKIVRLGPLPVSLFGGVRYWAQSPDSGPDDIGLRLGMTVLLPRP